MWEKLCVKKLRKMQISGNIYSLYGLEEFNTLKMPIVLWLCGSVGASSHKPKGCKFNSWSGHMPRLWVLSLVRVHLRGNQSVFPSHIDVSLSPPPFLSLYNQ